MWEETRMNFSSGAYGDPQSLETLKMFWQTMYKLSYPGAKEALEYIEVRLQNELDRQEIDNLYKKRELQLKQSEIQSNDMAKDREVQTAANQANAKLLEAMKKE